MSPEKHLHHGGARPAQRDDGARRAHAVAFGPFALLAGTGVTHILLAVAAGVSFGWPLPAGMFSFTVLAAILGLPFAVIGCVLALTLGLALRPVANQQLHVAAFFGAFALLATVILLLTTGSPSGALLMGGVIGAAAAVGRASVWKLVTLHP